MNSCMHHLASIRGRCSTLCTPTSFILVIKSQVKSFSWLPGPKPKLKIKAKTQAMLRYGKIGLTS